MASSGSSEKKETAHADLCNQPVFGRERSFVVTRRLSTQGGGYNGGNQMPQKRERSFVRENRSTNSLDVGKGGPAGKLRSHQKGNNETTEAAASRAIKPNMEIYRPPSIRNSIGDNPRLHVQSSTVPNQPRLTKSRTSLDMTLPTKAPVKRIVALSSTSSVVIATSSVDQHAHKLKGNTEVSMHSEPQASADSIEKKFLSLLPNPVQTLLADVAAGPDAINSRHVMEAVKTLFDRVIESPRYAAPAARYCLFVIEKETKHTFIESLLNHCQEYFHEHDQLLTSSASDVDEVSQHWVAFVNFLNELYHLLKRRTSVATHLSRPTPDLIILTLLAESCCVTLKNPSEHSTQELECLFFILTSIGRNMETELPNKMKSIWNAIRNAFLELTSLPSSTQRTLLQLVELRAAKWQLPVEAVTYYYPATNVGLVN